MALVAKHVALTAHRVGCGRSRERDHGLIVFGQHSHVNGTKAPGKRMLGRTVSLDQPLASKPLRWS